MPGCKNPATAPSNEDSNLSINMGIACHIYAAKPNGPRGQDNNSIEFLGSAENGLWCCCYHGSRIDKAGGEDHPLKN